jgi:hypothetical protein
MAECGGSCQNGQAGRVTLQAGSRRRAVTVELFTVGWNAIEAAVALAAGAVAGSVALIGFGLDSVVEVSARRSPSRGLQ